jgi:ectoine hydroxylase-related dioxygenase (phytanoyl-CoA dioxygenase family)
MGETVLPHPRNIARLMFPTTANAPTPPHQDYVHIQGTKAVYTCWLPLGDTTESLGGLQVMGGSHKLGLLPVRKSEGAGGIGVVLDGLKQEWSHGDFTAGDVLVFHSHTVHRSVPNQFKNRLRLSVDFRYQPVSLPIEQGSLLPHCGVLTWEEVYAGWQTTDLQYYWKQYLLEFQPYDLSLFDTHDDSPMMGHTGGMAGPMDGGLMGGQMGGPMAGKPSMS